mmetsp:Transcript_2694/g.3068  ORF Transcript_2694/g.3068 Transcript_2694/m.3068 type:complete len:409 (-) Transcript_2694:185-1411(-)|eukprot:CAMPEP_0197849874 /NCGR_PEP_ID=MMETSP1438-20131217/13514_1 /TAXON_ID=1461541 /ORGANISM="Pterosperma sp., Strain CCMP1384" /LENGTH=408 /DNA_ID=CAMNT_0043462753 /DNA_START=244 /DNA_END=1470 /DNA_ORIENTATION=+
MAAPDTPFAPGKNNLWTKILEHQKQQAKQPGSDQGRPDANLYFVGARHSGKSTLLNRFLYPDKLDTPKATEGLEYTYARKSVATNIERKDIAHIWELAGFEKLAEEITGCENIFLGMRQVATAVVVIVVDLSQPSEVLPTLEHWLNKIKSKTGATYEKLERRGSKLPEQLKLRAKKVFGTSHEDKDAVIHTGISVVVVAAKYDQFKDQDAEVRKIMARTLRYYAHTHGAALIYMGGLHSGADKSAKDIQENKALLNNFRALLNHLVFTGPDRKISTKLTIEMDHLKPLIIPAGSDRLRDIGRPRGTDSSGDDGALGEWRAVFKKLFPPGPKKEAEAWTLDNTQYAESVVDGVISQKQAELVAYKKQQQATVSAVRAMAGARGSSDRASRASTSSKSKSSSSSSSKPAQ